MDNLEVLKNIKVLYVEDEPITRLHVSKILKQNLGEVILAENGESGIKKFMEYNPDIIITDLVMPDMSGIDMMKRIRAMGEKCPVIVTSALSDSQTILETVDLKIEKYLIKPVDENKLIKKLIEITIEEIENNDEFISSDEFNLTDEKKQQFQLEIRNIYSKHLKKNTGKGAKIIQVSIKGSQIEILSKDNLTIIEESLLCAGRYSKGIEIIRKAIYENTKEDIEKQIEEVISRSVKLKKIEIFVEEKYERIIFNIVKKEI